MSHSKRIIFYQNLQAFILLNHLGTLKVNCTRLAVPTLDIAVNSRYIAINNGIK